MDKIDRAIARAKEALDICDEQGLIYPAIELSSAIEKLQRSRSSQRLSEEQNGNVWDLLTFQ